MSEVDTPVDTQSVDIFQKIRRKSKIFGKMDWIGGRLSDLMINVSLPKTFYEDRREAQNTIVNGLFKALSRLRFHMVKNDFNSIPFQFSFSEKAMDALRQITDKILDCSQFHLEGKSTFKKVKIQYQQTKIDVQCEPDQYNKQRDGTVKVDISPLIDIQYNNQLPLRLVQLSDYPKVVLSFPVTKKFRENYTTTNMRQNLKELAENVEKVFDKLVDWIRIQDPEIFSTRIASQKSTVTARQQSSIIAPPKSTRTAPPKSSKEQLSEIQQYIESELKKIKKLPPLRLANCVYKKILDRLENKDENYDLYLSALDQIERSFNVNQKLLEIREQYLLSPENKQHIPTPDIPTTTITPESTSILPGIPTTTITPESTSILPGIPKAITRPDSKHKPTTTTTTSNPDLQRKQQSILREKILSWFLFWKNQQQMIKSATRADLDVYSKRLIQYNPTTQKAKKLKQHLLTMISKERAGYTDTAM